MLKFVKDMIQRRRDRPVEVAPNPPPTWREPTIPRMPEDQEARLYTIATRHVARAERTGSFGPDKSEYAKAAIRAEFTARGWEQPSARDLNLAIEVAVREISR